MTISRRNFLLGAGAGALAAPGVGGLLMGQNSVELNGARQDSLWTAEIPSLPAQRRFEGERKVDLAVVGGGYTGLACAYYAKLFRPDWTVIVLESHRIGSGASSRNSGVVQAQHVGISDPEMPRRGLKRLVDFIDNEQISCDFEPTSTLMMASPGSRPPTELAPGEKWISPEQLQNSIGSGYYAGAIDSPNYFKIHPAKLVAGHARAASRIGVELFEHSPALNIQDGKPAIISTTNGSVVAKNVMIATNAYTPRLGFYGSVMYPIHQYSLATRKLTSGEIASLGLDKWSLRFESHMLPVTYSLTPSGHFFVRIVLGYASFNSCEWPNISSAKKLAMRIFEQRYPGIAELGLPYGWHGVTGHTAMMRPVAGTYGKGTIHVSAAYNGSGIMPAHNSGYLSACRITGEPDNDVKILTDASTQVPMPGDFYRSLMLKPFMKVMTPV